MTNRRRPTPPAAAAGGRRGARDDRDDVTSDLSAMVVRAVTVLGVAGAALSTALVLQGAADVAHSHPSPDTLLATSTGTLTVGTPSVTLVHQPNEMVGMPASAAHQSGGEVLVPVTLRNTSHGSMSYAAGQFHLLVDGETVDAGGEAAQEPGRELRPGAAITLRLTFDHVSLIHGGQLRYEPATGRPVTAPLEAVGEGTPQAAVPAGGPTTAADSTHHEHEGH